MSKVTIGWPDLFRRQQFFLFLLQTVRAHAVGGFGVKFGIEIFFHRHPLVVVANLAAPAADAQIFFEMMQAQKQPSRERVHPKPNDQNDHGAQDGAIPIGHERLAEKILRDMQQFRDPRQRDEKQKPRSFNPKDAARFAFPIHSFTDVARFK